MEDARKRVCGAIYAAGMCGYCRVEADYCKLGTADRRSHDRRMGDRRAACGADDRLLFERAATNRQIREDLRA